MHKNRLEAFSDGVIAIIITIMVLEIKTPEHATLQGFQILLPTLFGYFLSFVFVGIYWNNHHHLVHTVKHVTPAIMWANLKLLFWLSLVPFATKWMDEQHFNAFTVITYAILLILCGISFNILSLAIYKSLDEEDKLKKVLKFSFKDFMSIFLYTASIPIACWNTNISLVCFLIVAGIWIIPSKTIEKELVEKS
jgi:uncharacterized membrane protein